MYKEIEKLYDFKVPVKSMPNMASYFIEKQLDTPEKIELFNKFKDLLEKVYDKDIRAYLDDKKKIMDTLIDTFKESEVYKTLQNTTIDGSSAKSTNNVVHFLSTASNPEDYVFIGVDVKEGNFNALKYFLKSIVSTDEQLAMTQKCSTTEKLISSNNFLEFSKSILKDFPEETVDVLLASKGFRQIVFGNLSPKKWTLILSNIIVNIKKEVTGLPSVAPIIVIESQDEVMYAVNKYHAEPLKKLLIDLQRRLNGIIRVEEVEFKILDGIKSNPAQEGKKYYMEIKDGRRKLKTVPKDIYIPMYVKYILEEDFQEEDLYHEIDGNVYKLMLF